MSQGLGRGGVMLLKRLKLKNFISYKELDLEFPQGSIVFIGENGAGKSSILDAILFALYKENSRGRGLQDLVKRGERYSRVELVFNVDNKEYKVVREILIEGKRVQSNARLYEICEKGEVALATRSSDVDFLIPRKTGIDKNIFMTSIYVRQGEIAKLIELRPAERKQIISKLLGIDDLERAYVNMREVLAHYEKILRKIEGSLGIKPTIEKEYQNVCREIEKIKKDIISTERDLILKKEDFKRLEAEKKILEEKRSRYQNLILRREILQREINNLRVTLGEIKKNLRQAKEASRQVEKLRSHIIRLERIEKAYELYKNIELLRSEKRRILDKLTEYSEYKNKLEKYEKVREEYDQAMKGYKELLEEISAETHLKRYLDGLINDYNRRKKEVEYLKSWVDGTFQVLKELSLSVSDELEHLEESYQKKLEEVESDIRSVQEEIEKLREKKSSLKGIIEEKMKLIKKLEAVKDKCPLCGSKITEEHRRFLIDKCKEEIEKLMQEEENIARELKNNNVHMENLSDIRDKLLRIDVKEILDRYNKLREVESDLILKESSIKETKQKLCEIESRKMIIKELEKRIKELEPIYNEYIAAKNIVSKINAEQLEDSLKNIEKRIQELHYELESLGCPEIPSEREIAQLREMRKKYYEASAMAKELENLLEKREELKKKLDEYLSEISLVSEEIGKLGYSEEHYDKISKEYQEVMNELAKKEEVLKGLKKIILDYYQRRNKLSRTLDELRNQEKRLNDLIDYMSFLKQVRNILGKDGLQQILRKRAIPLIQRYVREFAALFEFDFYGIRMTDDYDVYIIDSEGERSIDSASGGEKVAIALALRLAIARVFQGDKLSMLMLDEPTQYLDENRRHFLVSVLKKLFTDEEAIFPQLILVTHDRELEDAADILYRVEKVGFSSRVSKVAS